MGNMFYSYCPNNVPSRCSSDKQSIITADMTEKTVKWDKLTYMPTAAEPTFDACSYQIKVPSGTYHSDSKLSITFTKLDNINAYLKNGPDFKHPTALQVVPNDAGATVDTEYTIPHDSL